ncbi:DUF2065 family protein [Oceaniglobus roseus]|uniref:DUF2065 family protein n=1 Tax=Oceaniglobus roseus TaxID=1737570 RepID=UPI000C7F19FA|nr:DUF2065 family protein [Kandeliimicrobium roseum]
MGLLLVALGLVFCLEGLVFALAPSRLQDLLAALARLEPEQRRMLGLAALALGVALVWLGRAVGG